MKVPVRSSAFCRVSSRWCIIAPCFSTGFFAPVQLLRFLSVLNQHIQLLLNRFAVEDESQKESALGVDHFLALVRKYTDIKELTAEIIREFVEKIYVNKAERIDGRRVQRIKIIYNCIGEFNPPVSTSTTEKEKSA
jgi:hypothetical protein